MPLSGKINASEKDMRERKKCSRWESNPRPLVHKTNDLPIDLQELLCFSNATTKLSTLSLII